MRYLKNVSLLFGLFFFFCSNIVLANSVAFNSEQLTKIKTQKLGEQWLMLLWSVDCPPCFKELGIIQKLQKQHQNLNVVIINTDADDEIKAERIDKSFA